MGKLHAVTWFSMPIARLKVWRNFQVYPEFSLRNSLPASVLDVMICHPFEDVLWCVCTSSRKNGFIHWQLAMNESARNVAPPLHSVPPQIALNWKPGKMEMSNLSNQKKKKKWGKNAAQSNVNCQPLKQLKIITPSSFVSWHIVYSWNIHIYWSSIRWKIDERQSNTFYIHRRIGGLADSIVSLLNTR